MRGCLNHTNASVLSAIKKGTTARECMDIAQTGTRVATTTLCHRI
jgi:hypothetical protein